MVQPFDFAREQLNIFLPFVARHRHDLGLTPVIVVGQVMHLLVEQIQISAKFTEEETVYVEWNEKSSSAFRARSLQVQFHSRGHALHLRFYFCTRNGRQFRYLLSRWEIT